MARNDPDAADGAHPPMTRWQRITGTVSNFMLKPAPVDEETGKPKEVADEPTTIPEIEAAIKTATDKERVIGLLAAPVAAAIGLIITAALVAHDPAATYSNGQIDKLHVNPSIYSELGAVTLALALLMLGAAWFRKRLLLGIAMALYGLSVFNLHYWGFGIPFIMGGAWYLVRAYRLSEKLKHAKADATGGTNGYSTNGFGPPRAAPPSKRYTPPTAPVRRTPKPKRGKELEAG
jgi:hypothetical protein